MKPHIRQLLDKTTDAIAARNLLREYLQARMLGGMQRAGAMIPLAFQGGTALRFLYNIPRFSEDLDFALERPDRGFDLRALLARIRVELESEGYEVELKVQDSRAVRSATLRFPGLLFEMELSPRREEILSVKLEVDTAPPSGAALETTLIRRYVTLQLQHHDQASLLAGKCHAFLMRPYTKGRDLYDLFWYLNGPDWPSPNFALLNSALAQTEWEGPDVRPGNWRGLLAEKVAEVDFARALEDVRPFLEVRSEVDMLTKDNLLRLLRSRAPGG
ncbi:MAG: nucleotidyl transferase AbiEii/AbiGii toxin family protein [Polyangia bacterium]|nr:nucleotidyl transferase AbiEii/AbiGii toxin family protein [Polyangia bacterium]